MLYHLSGHLQKQPKGKHKLNKVDGAGVWVCSGVGAGRAGEWGRYTQNAEGVPRSGRMLGLGQQEAIS